MNDTLASGSFNFQLNTNLRFGVGALATLPQTIKDWGSRHVAVIVDSGSAKNQQVQELLAELQSGSHYLQVEPSDVVEPDYDYLDAFRQRFTPEVDLFIGIGGGSILDLTKAISVLVTNPEPAISYRGFDLIKQPGAPVVAVPTTAGTGSEVTPNAVFTDKKAQRKMGINTALYLPKLAVLDPLTTMSCPRSVTVSSGMDALVHSIESFVARKGTPASRVWSRAAFELVFNTLPQVVRDPQDVEARSRMQLGSYYAGIALLNAGAGPAGAMSYPLGARFGVPHGLAGAVFIAPVAQGNIHAGATVYSELYDLMEGADQRLPIAEKAAEFGRRLQELCESLDLPQTLEQFGLSRADIDMFAEQTLLLQGALDQNPVPFGQEDVRTLLDQMLK